MINSDIELYTTADGHVYYRQNGAAAIRLEERSREPIVFMLDIIRKNYPEAHDRLIQIYSRYSKNKYHQEYRMVRRFCACNFSADDRIHPDIRGCVFHFEEAHCPLRGECDHEGVICKPKFDTDLTAQEMNVVRLFAQGLSMESVAIRLSISTKTIKNHKSSIFRKLNVCSTQQVIAYYYQNNLD